MIRKSILLDILLFVFCMLLTSCVLTNGRKEDIKAEDNSIKLQEIAKSIGIAKYEDIKEIEDRNVFLTSSLRKVYESFSKSKDESLLTQLEPIDIYRIYNNAELKDDYGTACALINIPKDVDKDEFIQEWKNDKVAINNGKKLLSRYKEKGDQVFQVRIDSTTAFIIFKGKEQYRLEKVEPGIWKIGWLALQ